MTAPLDPADRRLVLADAVNMLREHGDGPEALAVFTARYGNDYTLRGVFEAARKAERSQSLRPIRRGHGGRSRGPSASL